MNDLQNRLNAVNWQDVSNNMHIQGYTLVENFLSSAEAQTLIDNYDDPALYRKTINMERYRFGRGEYKYFNYPLPGLVQALRESIYPKLAPIANSWMQALGLNIDYPDTLAELHQRCHQNGQTQATVLILKYGKGGYNTLHQDLYGDVFFPIQMVLFLNEPGSDYTGGEFVLTQQIPRAQSKAIVLQPKKGDLLVFTTNFKPEKGSSRYYRVAMKHGVSEVHSGQRYTLGIIFHDALA